MKDTIVIATSRYAKYACARCRERKVKCDKALPFCGGCGEALTRCLYSARRPRKKPKIEISGSRPLLRLLENLSSSPPNPASVQSPSYVHPVSPAFSDDVFRSCVIQLVLNRPRLALAHCGNVSWLRCGAQSLSQLHPIRLC